MVYFQQQKIIWLPAAEKCIFLKKRFEMKNCIKMGGGLS